MPGGLLNIIAYGNSNIILNGNPSKTFFKSTYAKYTNFGMQKIRIDHNSNRNLDVTNETLFTFKVPRHAELLMDTYLVMSLPHIWSSIIPPVKENDIWKAYQFKWVKHFGTTAIKNVRVMIGSTLIQEYTGDYLRCMTERDFDADKKKQFDMMSGNVAELNEPEYYENRNFHYPNAFSGGSTVDKEPSIRGRKIYIPLCPWFMNSSKFALPLVSLQYSEVTIEVTLRPIKELFTINTILPITDNNDLPYETKINNLYQRIQPDFTIDRHNMYRFLQPPPDIVLNPTSYDNKFNTWNADVHLIANYGFLTSEESTIFACNEQKYLIRDVKTTLFHNIVGTKKLKVDTNALVSNWMWFYRRSDAFKRNEWSNYTNWKTSHIPYDLISEIEDVYDLDGRGVSPSNHPLLRSMDGTPNQAYDEPTNHRITPDFSMKNTKFILETFSIIVDGKIRETDFDAGVYQYIEKYNNTKSTSDCGIYHYNFCLDTTNYMQPTGAMNLSRFKNIEFEITTLVPNVRDDYESLILCDEDGGIIGVTQTEEIYDYTYTMHLFEERYNILRILSGNGGLLFAR